MPIHPDALEDIALQAHEDGPAYHPGVCILSLGGSAVMRFHQKVAGRHIVSPKSCILSVVEIMPKLIL